MAKGGSKLAVSGGGGTVLPVTKVLAPPTAQQVASGNILPQGGVPYDEFSQMTDDEKADVISDALGVGVPIFLDDSGMQRFAYYTGMSDKPTVVSDSALDSMSGTEIFRTVNDAYNRNTDIGYTANDICKQISQGDFTMYSDSGGSCHGKAIYFADQLNRSTAYAQGRNDLTMRAKVTGGKGISETALSSQYSKALRSGDKLAVACSKADGASRQNLYALAKGYTHVSDSGTGYNMILNRSCLTVSSDFKKTSTLGGRW